MLELRTDKVCVWISSSNWDNISFRDLLTLGGHLVEKKYGVLPVNPEQLQALQSLYPAFFILNHQAKGIKRTITLPTTKLEEYLNLPPLVHTGKLEFYQNNPEPSMPDSWYVMYLISFAAEMIHYCRLLAELPFESSSHWQVRDNFWETF